MSVSHFGGAEMNPNIYIIYIYNIYYIYIYILYIIYIYICQENLSLGSSETWTALNPKD